MNFDIIAYTEIEQLRKHLECEFHPVKVHIGGGIIGLLRGIDTREGKTEVLIDLPQMQMRFDWAKSAKRFEYTGTVDVKGETE